MKLTQCIAVQDIEDRELTYAMMAKLSLAAAAERVGKSMRDAGIAALPDGPCKGHNQDHSLGLLPMSDDLFAWVCEVSWRSSGRSGDRQTALPQNLSLLMLIL